MMAVTEVMLCTSKECSTSILSLNAIKTFHFWVGTSLTRVERRGRERVVKRSVGSPSQDARMNAGV